MACSCSARIPMHLYICGGCGPRAEEIVRAAHRRAYLSCPSQTPGKCAGATSPLCVHKCRAATSYMLTPLRTTALVTNLKKNRKHA